MKRTSLLLLAALLVAACSDSTNPLRQPGAANFNDFSGGRGPDLGTPQVSGASWYANGTASQAVRQLQAAEVGVPPNVAVLIDVQISAIGAAVQLASPNHLTVIATVSGRVFFDKSGNVTQQELKQDIVLQ